MPALVAQGVQLVAYNSPAAGRWGVTAPMSHCPPLIVRARGAELLPLRGLDGPCDGLWRASAVRVHILGARRPSQVWLGHSGLRLMHERSRSRE
jgi:hypothetical protein